MQHLLKLWLKRNTLWIGHTESRQRSFLYNIETNLIAITLRAANVRTITGLLSWPAFPGIHIVVQRQIANFPYPRTARINRAVYYLYLHVERIRYSALPIVGRF